jgi:hypothetical protein
MAVYAEIERLANKRKEGDYFEPFIAIATKEKIVDKEIISFISEEQTVAEFVSNKLMEAENNIERIKLVKSGQEKAVRCEKCDHCKKTKVLTGTTHYTKYISY